VQIPFAHFFVQGWISILKENVPAILVGSSG